MSRVGSPGNIKNSVNLFINVWYLVYKLAFEPFVGERDAKLLLV
jgi:hypothetical protein